jgi:Protein of unknown function (DUF1625).
MGKFGTSPGSNKKGGLLTGVLAGLLMVIIGTVLLWWNEGNNVRNIKTTDEIEKTVVDISPDTDPAEFGGQLVALGGPFTVEDEKVTDGQFNVSHHTAYLRRVVEIYQWEEESHTDDDGGTTYTYKKVWHEGVIDSSNFEGGHDNSAAENVPFSSEGFCAEDVTLGKFRLSSTQIEMMETERSLPVSDGDLTLPKGYAVNGKYVTNSAEPSSPQIGDVRISWQYNGWKEVSVLAKLTGTTFTSWTSQVGKPVNRVFSGVRSSGEMLEIMRNEDKLFKWAMRLLGLILIFAGYMSFISPLTKLVGYIPILGNVVNFTFGLIIFLLSLVQSLLVIIIAWFRFRPVLSIFLLVVVAVIGGLVFYIKKKHPTSASQPPQTPQTV